MSPQRRVRTMSRLLMVLVLILTVYVIFGNKADAATVKRCSNARGTYGVASNITATPGTQCQFARLMFYNWEVSTAAVPGSTRIHGYICRSRFVGVYVVVNCTTRRFFVRWRTPIEGES